VEFRIAKEGKGLPHPIRYKTKKDKGINDLRERNPAGGKRPYLGSGGKIKVHLRIKRWGTIETDSREDGLKRAYGQVRRRNVAMGRVQRFAERSPQGKWDFVLTGLKTGGGLPVRKIMGKRETVTRRGTADRGGRKCPTNSKEDRGGQDKVRTKGDLLKGQDNNL